MTWNLIILIITSDISSWSSSAWSVSSELHNCIKHQKNVKHSDFFNSQLHGFIPMKELSKHTSKAQIAGESQTLFCEDLTIASLQPIAMIVIDIFSSWYACHHLSTKLDISMAAYIDLTEEIIADLHPEVVYIFDAVSEGFHLQVDETKTTKTTKTTNIVSDIWFIWSMIEWHCRCAWGMMPSLNHQCAAHSTNSSKFAEERIPQMFRKWWKHPIFRTIWVDTVTRVYSTKLIFEICLAFGVQHHLHKSPCLCKIYVLSARQEMRSKSLDVLMEQHIEKLSHLISVHSQCQENCL